MSGFVASQEAQVQNQTKQREDQTKQREDQATFHTQMLQVLQRLIPPTQVIVPAQLADPNDMYDKFKKRNPPGFCGNEDPLIADEWVVQMEKIFQVFQRIHKMAVYLFKGVAKMWWKSVKTPYDTIAEDTAWTSFQTILCTRYIPPHIQAQKLIESESLV